ncbi:Putative TRAP-type C4-dicarboxylate transport system, DctP subunit [Desulfatibacillum aliphaticivorans]|uniref:TRAP-type C4-dicarboxylate transport system, DctP subunit n=1 Tax=Desulfatibacillum aliphaticivorans TaxID=218208 RepID=B8FJB9_DESAL|nr:TRAP transporter substrate-binding protein DctP [Desulfatibacillum aliphaticivorans]ACL05588.1 Putative TRAP-type C4-dicarboxylate transport system, DctP subunit [Desulfatibacillum aliphaticivorans]
MKARSLFWAVLSIVCLTLAAPGYASAAEVVWKAGTLVPKGVGYANQIQNILNPGLAKATDGQVFLKVYYGGVMGDDEDYLKKMRIGQLQGTGTSVQGALMVCPEMGAVNLPMMFKNWDEVDYIKKKMYPVYDGVLNDKGFKLILWLDQGFDQFYSVKFPLDAMDQFKKVRFVTWCGDIEEEFFTAIGATAIPVNAPELNTSLRQGLADAYIGPPIWALSTQMYSVVRYISALNVRYSPSVFIITMEAWEALSPQQQQNIMAAREQWQTDFCEGSRQDNDKCLEAMFKYGVTKVEMSPNMEHALYAAVRPLWDELVGEYYSQEILDEIVDNLDEFRQSQ